MYSTLVREDEKTIRKALNLFLLLFLMLGGVLGGMVAIYYQSQLSTLLSEIKSRETNTIELQRRLIGNEFQNIVSDLLILAGQNELQALFSTSTADVTTNIAAEYVNVATYKKVYDQIRYLNENGLEIVRVNFNNGHPAAVGDSILQDKSKRYYFSDSFRLKRGEIFISAMDLNIEQEKIEQPLKPMIRFGTPVFDTDGAKRGIVIINYLANNLLNIVRKAGNPDQGSPMLLNNDGYWLLSNKPEDEWGFMIKERAASNFARSFPDEWAQILTSESGQLSTPNGLFTFSKIYPLQGGRQSSSDSAETYASSVELLDSGKYFWTILSYIPSDRMNNYIYSIQLKLFLLGASLFVVIALGAWFLSLAITKRRIYQSQLLNMALYDALTGLPNRKLFFDRLETGIEHAQRHERRLGLLYIDLDGFKEVNDIYGHEAGDELLVKVGEIMRAVSRKSDTIARLGGDEFAIVLFEINSQEDVLAAGDKIITALCEPIAIKMGKIKIGASIGAAVYPDTVCTLDALVHAADQAMYLSKAKGRNACTMAQVHSQA